MSVKITTIEGKTLEEHSKDVMKRVEEMTAKAKERAKQRVKLAAKNSK